MQQWKGSHLLSDDHSPTGGGRQGLLPISTQGKQNKAVGDRMKPPAKWPVDSPKPVWEDLRAAVPWHRTFSSAGPHQPRKGRLNAKRKREGSPRDVVLTGF